MVSHPSTFEDLYVTAWKGTSGLIKHNVSATRSTLAHLITFMSHCYWYHYWLDGVERRPGSCCRCLIVSFCFLLSWRKLAKKRKETLNSTRQEMTVMVNSMDKSYTEQGTNCDEALSFMDTHNHTLTTRSECALTLTTRSECALTLNGRGKTLATELQTHQMLRVWFLYVNTNRVFHVVLFSFKTYWKHWTSRHKTEP